MPNILVRDLSEETHHALQRRAEQRGQSLQQYLAAELARLAVSPTLEDVLRRIESRDGGRVGLTQATADLAEERSRG
ncbi:MAG: hypothetical protein WCB57_03595 [Pseudonocardiaceae bacterium]